MNGKLSLNDDMRRKNERKIKLERVNEKQKRKIRLE